MQLHACAFSQPARLSLLLCAAHYQQQLVSQSLQVLRQWASFTLWIFQVTNLQLSWLSGTILPPQNLTMLAHRTSPAAGWPATSPPKRPEAAQCVCCNSKTNALCSPVLAGKLSPALFPSNFALLQQWRKWFNEERAKPKSSHLFCKVTSAILHLYRHCL